MARTEYALTGFLIRVIATTVIVMLTYNPSGWSYFHWLWNAGFDQDIALKVLAGLILVTAYVVLLRATFFAIGAAGIVLVGAIVAGIVWVAVDFGLLEIRDTGILQWIILIGIGLILGVGLSWALIRRRLSGQYSVDDVETDSE